MPCSRSPHRDAAERTSAQPFFTAPKRTMLIGAWNVKTLYQGSKAAQAAKVMREHKLGLLGISECRWDGDGETTLQTGETILYSGRSDGSHQEGVALMLTSSAKRSLIFWRPLGSRLLMARFKGRYVNMSVIVCYAPTNEADDETKDLFYDQLQELKNKCPRHDILIILGDLNAKVGSDNMNYTGVMGPHGVGQMNENGERLVDICCTSRMVKGESCFPSNRREGDWERQEAYPSKMDDGKDLGSHRRKALTTSKNLSHKISEDKGSTQETVHRNE